MPKTKTHEEYENEVFEKFGEIYVFLSKYKGSSKKINVKHKDCGNEWSPYACNLLQGKSKCPECSGKKKYTTESFGKALHDKFDGEFELISEYKHSKTDVKIKHEPCGYERWVNPFDVYYRGAKCPRCSNRMMHSTEDVKYLIQKIHGSEYELLSECNRSDDIILVKHICNNEYNTTPTDLLYKSGYCPSCFEEKISKGEHKVKLVLESMNLLFEREWHFEDCVNTNVLPFDFVIFDMNGNVDFIIEFDGQQHFEPVKWFGGEESFKKTIVNDEIKNQYCEDNGYRLLRIPYWEFSNIEDTIANFVKEGDEK